MEKKLIKWWEGYDRGYAMSDEPSPKEAAEVLLFFVIPMYTILIIIFKIIHHAQL